MMSTILCLCLVTAAFLVIAKADLPDFCKLPPDTRPCDQDLVRYFYDAEDHVCKKFRYGGCPGNDNNFLSKKDCVESCQKLDDLYNIVTKSESESDSPLFGMFHNVLGVAMRELHLGSCPGSAVASVINTVRRFFGVGPVKIISSCRTTPSDVCHLASDPGPCRSSITKFYYNSSTGTCEKFNYGGCLGNKNKFDNKQECQTFCYSSEEVCNLPSDPGNCYALIESYFYNATSGKCETFNYGGCDGNANMFPTKAECKEKCQDELPIITDEVCKLPSVRGTCRGHFLKFHFNANSGQCEQFIYGGCGGNDNKFHTKEECEQKCKVEAEPKSEYFCLIQPEKGPCEAYQPKYFYNVTTAKCEVFIYGGCPGNANRFETKKDCQINCRSDTLPPPENICLLQPDSGPCEAIIPRFFYNVTTRTCQSFTYGGCGGNDNRFKTKPQCQERCKAACTSPTNICNLTPEVGTCLALIPQYFYNSTSGKCETFTWGGCGGNENRFGTKQDCLGNCSTTSN